MEWKPNAQTQLTAVFFSRERFAQTHGKQHNASGSSNQTHLIL
jgi:hypothetical protein